MDTLQERLRRIEEEEEEEIEYDKVMIVTLPILAKALGRMVMILSLRELAKKLILKD